LEGELRKAASESVYGDKGKEGWDHRRRESEVMSSDEQ
jgi:hypothetical protein